jgi:hypothetical protein
MRHPYSDTALRVVERDEATRLGILHRRRIG